MRTRVTKKEIASFPSAVTQILQDRFKLESGFKCARNERGNMMVLFTAPDESTKVAILLFLEGFLAGNKELGDRILFVNQAGKIDRS